MRVRGGVKVRDRVRAPQEIPRPRSDFSSAQSNFSLAANDSFKASRMRSQLESHEMRGRSLSPSNERKQNRSAPPHFPPRVATSVSRGYFRPPASKASHRLHLLLDCIPSSSSIMMITAFAIRAEPVARYTLNAAFLGAFNGDQLRISLGRRSRESAYGPFPRSQVASSFRPPASRLEQHTHQLVHSQTGSGMVD